MYGINFEGLRRRQTYDEVVDYLQNDRETVKYPDRSAKFLRESPEIMNLLDGEGIGYDALVDQQRRALIQQKVKTIELEKAQEQQTTPAHARATVQQSRAPSDVSMFEWGSAYEDMQQDIEMDLQAAADESRKRRQQIYDDVQDDLGASSSSFAQQMASASAASSSNQPRDDVEQTAIAPIEVDPAEKKRAMDDKPRDDAKPKKVKDNPPINITGEMIRKIADVDLALKAIKESKKIPAQIKAKDNGKKLMLGNISGDTGGTGDDSPSRRIRVKQSIGKDKSDESPARSSASRDYGTQKDSDPKNRNRSYWRNKKVGYIVDQISAFGIRPPEGALTGTKKIRNKAGEVIREEKVRKLNKDELLDMLFEKLGI